MKVKKEKPISTDYTCKDANAHVVVQFLNWLNFISKLVQYF